MGSDPQGLTMEGDLEATGGFEQVSRAEMHEQRKDWESYVFTPFIVDEAALRSKLEKTFNSKDTRSKLRSLWKEVKDFGKRLSQSYQFDKEVMK